MRDIEALFRDRERVLAAMKRGVQRALWRHKQLGQSIVIWENGRVVEIAAEDIDVEEPDVIPSEVEGPGWGRHDSRATRHPGPSTTLGMTRAGSAQVKDIEEFFADDERVLAAMKRGVQRALWRHKQLGQSIVIWENGRVVEIAAEDIDVEEPD